MGSGASSLFRLRKSIVIRAYNLRDNDKTLDDQFRPLAFRSPHDGKLFIKIVDIKKCLQYPLSSGWIDEAFRAIDTNFNGDVAYQDFIELLESGTLPQGSAGTSISRTNSTTTLPAPSDGGNLSREEPSKVLEPSTVGSPFRPDRSNTVVSSSPQHHGKHALSASPSRLEPATKNKFPPIPPDIEESYIVTEDEDSHDFSNTYDNSAALVALTSSSHPDSSVSSGVATKSMWRKREIVKHERIVEYTTITADGDTQELIEKEIQETEVLHMECRETGEFAHRETTTVSQIETFNGETVNDQRGTEEYIHMKSNDDELEFMESNLPKKEEPTATNDLDQEVDHIDGSQARELYDSLNSSHSIVVAGPV